VTVLDVCNMGRSRIEGSRVCRLRSVVDEGIDNGRGFDDDEDAQQVLNVEEPASVSVCGVVE
jgi:hypothetical protein